MDARLPDMDGIMNAPDLERSRPRDQEPAGRREIVAIAAAGWGGTRTPSIGRRTSNVEWGKDPMQAEDAGGAPALHTDSAYPTLGDAPGIGRGARRATGTHAQHQPILHSDFCIPHFPQIGAGAPRRRRPAASPQLPAYPTPGDAPGLGRGARRATGNHAQHQPILHSHFCILHFARTDGEAH
jgi:hypothetical protein